MSRKPKRQDGDHPAKNKGKGRTRKRPSMAHSPNEEQSPNASTQHPREFKWINSTPSDYPLKSTAGASSSSNGHSLPVSNTNPHNALYKPPALSSSTSDTPYDSGEQSATNDQATVYTEPSSYPSSAYNSHMYNTNPLSVQPDNFLAQNEPLSYSDAQMKAAAHSHVQLRRREMRNRVTPYAASRASTSRTANTNVASTRSPIYSTRMQTSRGFNNEEQDTSIPSFIRTSNSVTHASSSLSPSKDSLDLSGPEYSTPNSFDSSTSPSYHDPAWDNSSGHPAWSPNPDSSPIYYNIPSTPMNQMISHGFTDSGRSGTMEASTSSNYSPSGSYLDGISNNDLISPNPSHHYSPLAPAHYANLVQQSYHSPELQASNIVGASIPHRDPVSPTEVRPTSINRPSTSPSYAPSVPEDVYWGGVASVQQVEAPPSMNHDAGSATHAYTPIEHGSTGFVNNYLSAPVHLTPEPQASSSVPGVNAHIPPAVISNREYNFPSGPSTSVQSGPDLLYENGLQNTNIMDLLGTNHSQWNVSQSHTVDPALINASSIPASDIPVVPNLGPSLIPRGRDTTTHGYHSTLPAQHPMYPVDPQYNYANFLSMMDAYSSTPRAHMSSTPGPSVFTGVPSSIDAVRHETGSQLSELYNPSSPEQLNSQSHDPFSNTMQHTSYFTGAGASDTSNK